MIRIKDIQEGLKNLVGWEQQIGAYNIQDELLESESGLYFQGAHPLMTIDNIKSAMPKYDPSDVDAYNENKTYRVGELMKYNDVVYINRISCKGITPDVEGDYNEDYNGDYDPIYWEEYDNVAEYLKNVTKKGIAVVANEFISRKSLDKASKSLLEHKCLFDGAGRIKNRIASTHSLVGYEIQPLKGHGVTAQIHKIGLQMIGATGVVKVYLFHSSQSDPIKTFDLRVLKNGGYQWFTLNDVYLPYMGSDTVGGNWYICYAQDSLPDGMEAINVSKDWTREPCSTCNIGSVEDWRVMTKYMRVSPFRVSVSKKFANNPKMFDLADIVYTSQSCYGMNCELSIACDLTDFIIEQRRVFANVLQKQVAYDVLKTIAYNPEVNVNRNQSNVQRQDFLFEIDGNTYTKSSGLRGDLKKAYDALELDTEGMDSVCIACKKKGVKYTIA